MSGSHLDRIGFRHLVMGIAALSTLTGGLWTTSSFVGPIANRPFADTPTIEAAYNRISHLAVVIIAMNSCVAAIIILMSFIVDWHFDVLLAAYQDYAWIAIAWCIQLVSIIIIATAASPAYVCNPNNLVFGEEWSGSTMCSNWKAMLIPSIITLVALSFHAIWHMTFRLCYKSILSDNVDSFDFWKTPLPKKYLVRLKGIRRRRASISVEFGGKSRMTPLEPTSNASTPTAAQGGFYGAEDTTRDYFPSGPATTRPSAADLEKGTTPDSASIASSRVGKESPPGLEIPIETQTVRSADS